MPDTGAAPAPDTDADADADTDSDADADSDTDTDTDADTVTDTTETSDTTTDTTTDVCDEALPDPVAWTMSADDSNSQGQATLTRALIEDGILFHPRGKGG